MKKLSFTIGLMLIMVSLLAQQRGRPNISNGTVVTDEGNRMRGCYIYTDYYHNDPSEIRDGTKEGIYKARDEYGMNAFHFYCGWYATPTGRYQPLADSLVKWTREAGVYLVMTIGGWDKNGEFSLSKMREFWPYYAPRYADETHVIYEVYNEPEFVCNNPSSDATISMEVEAYDTIRKYAPNTHIIMRSYGGLVAKADYLLQDIKAMEDGGVDFSNASMGYHGYYWCSHARKYDGSCCPNSYELNIIPQLQDQGYAFINTEFDRDNTLKGDIEYSGELIEFYENDMEMSWLCFYSFPEIKPGHEAYLFSSSTDFKNEIDALSGEHDVTWCPDYGTWPQDCGGSGPTATAGSNSPVCVGDDINLTESGGDAVSWSWSGPNSFSSTDQNPTIANATTSDGGTYKVTITDADSETATDEVTVSVNSIPSANAGSNSPVCEGENINLTESGDDATGWSWSGPNSFSSTDQNPTVSSASTSADGTYTVTVTDANGCESTDNVDVTVNASPTATAGSNSPVDEGDDINLTESGGDATSWSWSGPNSFSSTDQNPTISSATSSADGTYTVTVTGSNGCESTDNVDVTVNTSSTEPGLVEAFAFGATDYTTETPNESGTNYTKIVQNSDGSVPEYTSTQGYGYTDTDKIDDTPNNRNSSACGEELYDQFIGVKGGPGDIVFRIDVPNGDYKFVTAMGDAQYSHTNTMKVRDGADGTTLTLIDEVDCSSDEYATVTFGDKSVPACSGATFTSQPESPALTVTNEYIDIIQASPSNGGDLVFVEVWRIDEESSTPTATAGSNSPVCVGEDIHLTESGGDATSWSWSGPNSFSSTDQNPTISSASTSAAGTYTVTITDANSNTATDEVSVTVNSLPTATAGSNSPVCEGADINLTESGDDATSWSWSGPNSFSSTDQNPTVSSASTSADGTYTVTVTDPNGCESTDNVDVTVNASPTATAGSNSPVDEGNDINLSESGGDATSWSWSGPNSFSSTDQNPTISSATTSADGIYTVTVTDANGCENTDDVDVTVNSSTPGPAMDTVNPIDDATVYNDSPDRNYGNKSDFKVVRYDDGHDEQAYLKFDLSHLSSSGTVSSAKLRLFVDSWNTGPEHFLKVVNDNNWSEDNITWNNRPTDMGNTIAEHIVDSRSWNEIELNENGITALENALGGEFSINISTILTEGITSFTKYYSSEQSGYVPELIIDGSNMKSGKAVSDIENMTTADANASIELYPNPLVGDALTIDLTGFAGEKAVDVIIYDINGKTVYAESVVINDSDATLKVDAGIFNAGMYLIKATGNDYNVSEKIIVK